MDHVMNTYNPLPIALDRGEGMWVWDTNGNKYLDTFSGIGVTGLGHSHPKVINAIQQQASKILHASHVYHITQQTQLAELLCQITGLDQVFFTNSGTEAIECALKLTRYYGHQKGIALPHIIVMKNAFHGRTFGALSAGGNKKVQAGFEPLMPGFIHVPFNDMLAVREQADHPFVAAVLVEPIQGEGGIRVPDKTYLKELRALCDQKGWLLIMDEVQTGMGRTGHFLAYQDHDIIPDIVTIAKGLANGVPIGACLAKTHVSTLFKPGNHGSTFGGNPLACAASLATVSTIVDNQLWHHAKKQGDLLLNGLKETLKNHPHVKDIRGKGLMLGVELDRPCRDILALGLKEGLLLNVTNVSVIRFLPPLIIEDSHIDMILNKLPKVIDDFCTDVSS